MSAGVAGLDWGRVRSGEVRRVHHTEAFIPLRVEGLFDHPRAASLAECADDEVWVGQPIGVGSQKAGAASTKDREQPEPREALLVLTHG